METGYLRLIYITEIIVLFIIAIQSWKVPFINRKIKLSFLGILISLITWCFGVFMMNLFDTVNSIWFWHEFKFVGIAMLPNFFLLFALNYTKRERYITPLLTRSLFIMTSIFLAVIASNQLTKLFRKSFQIVMNSGVVSVYTQNGPMFWVFTAYTYSILVIVVYLLWKRYRELPKAYKSQPLIMLMALILQAVINMSFIFNILENSHDPSAFIFGVSAIIFYWGLFYSVAPNIVPVARGLVFDNMHSMLFVKDINGYIVDYNKAAQLMIKRNNLVVDGLLFDGLAKKVITNKNAQIMMHNDREVYYVNDKNGERYYTMTESPIIHKEDVNGSVITVDDITTQMLYIDQLKKTALVDGLTGLFNRTHYEKTIKEWEENKLPPISVFYGGLNNFKLVNESFGTMIGDEVLIEVSNIINKTVPGDALVSRTGGDEFSIIIPEMSEGQAQAFRSKMEELINQIVIKNAHISITLACDTYDGRQESLSLVAVNALNKMYRKKLNESQSSRNAMIHSLKIALEQSNYETKAHADRTEELALAIGLRIGLSDSHLSDLSMLSSLHDLGKIAIPDSILNKPSKLTDEEFEIIKTHPQKGYVMAIASPELVHIADGILHHHERWDGNGYPDGLKGEEISIEARIISIVDAYDVMTNERPYKTAMTMEDAVIELMRCRGTQFDPRLVDVLIEVVTTENI